MPFPRWMLMPQFEISSLIFIEKNLELEIFERTIYFLSSFP